MIAREHWLPVYDFGNYGSSVFSNNRDVPIKISLGGNKSIWLPYKTDVSNVFAEVIMLGNWHMPMWSRKAEMCLEK